MTIALYRQYRQTLKGLPFSGQFMPYNWGNLPDRLDALWLPYSTMSEDFARELANTINAFTQDVQRLQAWVIVVEPLSDEKKMYAANEFVDALATTAVNMPYVIRSRFIFATAHLCHQANRAKGPGWKDDLPLDTDIHWKEADECGKPWRKYVRLKQQLEGISGRAYQDATHDFRNAYNHRFSSRFLFGITQLMKRTVDKPTGRVTYSFGGAVPLQLDSLAQLLIKERNGCYRAFDAFQALVHEHEDAIAKHLPS